MSTFLFIELPDGFEEMDIESAVQSTAYSFEEDEAEAKKIAESLGFGWPLWMARNERASFITVHETEIEDYDEYAERFIRREIELRKNPPKLIGGCMCGTLGQMLGTGHSCGCGPSCSCEK